MFAIPRMCTGGPDQVFYEIIKFFINQKEFKVILLTTKSEGYYFEKLKNKIDIHVIKRPTRLWSRYPLDAALIRIFKIKPDLIISTERMNLILNLLYPFLPKGTKLITRISNDIKSNNDFLRNSSFKRYISVKLSLKIISNSDLIITQSKFMLNQASELIFNPPQIIDIPNPIPSKIIDKKIKGKINKNYPTIISVGRLEYQKGYDNLLKSFLAVKKIFPSARLKIFGKGSQKNSLKKFIKDNHLAENIYLLGFSENISKELSNSDLFVLASRYEGLSNAVLEALAIGLPVVLTDCPGLIEN